MKRKQAMKKLFYIISIFTFYLGFTQNYFYRPIEYDILLSGNFGEIDQVVFILE